ESVPAHPAPRGERAHSALGAATCGGRRTANLLSTDTVWTPGARRRDDAAARSRPTRRSAADHQPRPLVNAPVSILLRILLRLYPVAFRDRYGEAMLAFHAERLAESRRTGEARRRVWRRMLVDLIACA